MIAATRTDVTDLTMLVAGQGGDGSLTIVTLLGRLLAGRGFHLHQTRDVRSRIKGGTAAALLRASTEPRRCIDDAVDLAIAFDEEALETAFARVREGSVVVFDASWSDAPALTPPAGVETIGVPFGRLSVRDLRRDLFKSSFAFGLATRLLSIPDAEAERALRERFRRLSEAALAANVAAARRGFAFAEENGVTDLAGAWRLAEAVPASRLLMTGNDAVALGFVVAGGRFFAGYPITPATEILEWLDKRLPALGGVVVQAEDELAAVNMAIGASLTGVRSMTATSGPGIALMQEGVSHAGSAEIPLVLVDCQRAGPSTGMPTKPEQSDLTMLALGANGDFPRIVVAPSDPAECFELTVAAVGLATDLQCPVYVVLDQAVAQSASTVDPLPIDAVSVTSGKRLDVDALQAMERFQRYAITDDGISPWAAPGTPRGMSLVTGNEHDEWGHVSIEPANRNAMVEKRRRKLLGARPKLPGGTQFGVAGAPVGVIAFGMAGAVAEEAVTRLNRSGHPFAGLRPRTLWPVTDDTLRFIEAHDRVVVVEHNASGQYAALLRAAGVAEDRIRSAVKYDGTTFGPAELAAAILTESLK